MAQEEQRKNVEKGTDVGQKEKGNVGEKGFGGETGGERRNIGTEGQTQGQGQQRQGPMVGEEKEKTQGETRQGEIRKEKREER
jgi:hypothetical protein